MKGRISEWRKRKFLAWEMKKRKVLGDTEFFEKYIKLYMRSDKFCKIMWSAATILAFLFMVFRIIVCIFSPVVGNIFFAVFSLCMFAFIFFCWGMYFLYLTDCVYMDHVKRWEHELEILRHNH